MTFIASIN